MGADSLGIRIVRTAIDASEDLFRFNPETNQPVLPKGRERMYHCLEATGDGGKTIYNTFSPEVRDNSYFHALNQIFRQIENTTGLSYGINFRGFGR